MSKFTDNKNHQISKFGWLYDLRSITSIEKTYELKITKYFFYISSNKAVIHLAYVTSFNLDSSSSNILVTTKIDSSEVDVKLYSLISTNNLNESKLLDLFEEFYSKNRNPKDLEMPFSTISSELDPYKLKLLKIGSLEIESELSDINFFFKIPDSSNSKCIIAKSSFYLTSTFIFQGFNGQHLESIYMLLKTLNSASNGTSIHRSRTYTLSNKQKDYILNNASESYKKFPDSGFLKEHKESVYYENLLKEKFNGKYFNQNNFDIEKITLNPIHNKTSARNSSKKLPNTNDRDKTEAYSTDSTSASINGVKNPIKLLNGNFKGESELLRKEEWGELSNKSHYSGHIKNGCPNGFGKEYRKDGQIYDGTFMNGKWHGEGILTNENLDSTVCEYINGRVSGI